MVLENTLCINKLNITKQILKDICSVWLMCPQKTCPHSNPQNLWMEPYLEKGLYRCTQVRDLQISII